jgi:triacylglycerol lipase
MDSKEVVILVHGFFKSKSDMNYLEFGLKKEGYFVLNIDLPTTFGSFEDCIQSMHLQVNHIVKAPQKIHFVAHSMGRAIAFNFLVF